MTQPEQAAPSVIPEASAEASAKDLPDAKDVSEARQNRRWLRRSVAVFALLLVGGGGFMAWEWQKMGLPLEIGSPHSKAPIASESLPPAAAPVTASSEDVTRQITALQDQLQTLQNRLVTNSPTGDLNAVGNRLQQVETSLRHLDSQPKVPATLLGDVEDLRKTQAEMKRTSADAATVLRLVERLERAESQIRTLQEQHANAVSLLLAVGQVRDAVQRALPYDDEWQVLRVLADGDKQIQDGLEALSSHRTSGIPTQIALTTRFGALAPTLLRAELLPNQGSWWQRSLDRLADLVLIRREDAQAAGDSIAAIVARTEAALSAQDLAAALRELSALPTAAAERAAPWLRDAQARLQAEQALSSMTARLIASQRTKHSGAGQ